MNTALRLDEQLLCEAERVASESGRSLTAVVEDALRQMLAERSKSKEKRRVPLPTFGLGELLPGADLDDSSSLRDLMDADDPDSLRCS